VKIAKISGLLFLQGGKLIFQKIFCEPLILQDVKTAKTDGALILQHGKPDKIRCPLILKEEKTAKISEPLILQQCCGFGIQDEKMFGSGM
jgi:hypothetical protein